MSRRENYNYYVEGENEECLLKFLKTDMQLIVPGKVQRFNVIQEKFTKARLMTLKVNIVAILVFDTDSGNDIILKENIGLLKNCSAVTSIICIPQVLNLEDELKRCCKIKQIKDLTGSMSNKDFKRDFMRSQNLKRIFEKHGFNIDKLWCENPRDGYIGIQNEAYKIKLKK